MNTVNYSNNVINHLKATESALTAQYEANSAYWSAERQYANRNLKTVSEQLINMEQLLKDVNDRAMTTESSGIRNTFEIISDDLQIAIRKKKCALTTLVDRAHETSRKSALIETTVEHHKMLLMMLAMQPDLEDPYRKYYYNIDYGSLSGETKSMLSDVMTVEDGEVRNNTQRGNIISTTSMSMTNTNNNYDNRRDDGERQRHSQHYRRSHNKRSNDRRDELDRNHRRRH